MKIKESGCVGCPKEIGCFGSSCVNYEITSYICDVCGDDNGVFHYDDNDYCHKCFDRFLKEEFDVLTTDEKADVLNVNYTLSQ